MASGSKLPRSSPLDTLFRKASTHRRAGESSSSSSQPTPAQVQSYYTSVGGQRRLSPTSPLLHSHFRGSSTTTSNDDSSYLDRSALYGDDSAESHYYDDESLYSSPSAHLSDDIDVGGLRNSWSDMMFNGGHESSRGSLGGPDERVVPTVVISPAEYEGSTPHGKARSLAVPPAANFSRPVHPLPLLLDEQKRQVLERNYRRFPTPYSSPLYSDPSITTKSHPPISHPRASSTSPSQTAASSSSSSSKTGALLSSNHKTLDLTVAPTYPSQPPRMPGIASASYLKPASPFQSPTSDSFDHLGGVSSPRPFSLSQLYPDVPSLGPTHVQQQMQQTDISSITPPPPSRTHTPQEYVQLGIQHHEANRLNDSASCFEKSAKELGGCGVGMLMWGLALRHGWGCDKDEKQGFKWLRKAAESAVVDLETARGGIDTNVVQTELVIAIYEVAQCFFQGWGVSKDQKMAVSYYAVAARLGDADAQHDLAFCLANGKGCKKDRKESAKWYRAAVAQGTSDVGLAWIYKEKFQ